MNGVDILATVPAVNNEWALTVYLILGIIALSVMAWAAIENGMDSGSVMASLIGLAACFFGLGVGFAMQRDSYYIAIVDKTVPYVEFNSAYKVLENYEDVYFLREIDKKE